MQSLYALEQTQSDNLDKEEKFLLFSIEQMHDLFLINLQLLVEIRKHATDFLEKSQKKYLATSEEKNPNQKFINNEILTLLEKNTELKEAIDHKKMNCWHLDDEYVKILWKEISESELYADYMKTKMSSFKEDKDFIIDVFKEAGLPGGVINVVFGDPVMVTETVLSSPDFSGLHFTGSTFVFKELWKQIGNNIHTYKTYPNP
jgi:N utilization substance protein B